MKTVAIRRVASASVAWMVAMAAVAVMVGCGEHAQPASSAAVSATATTAAPGVGAPIGVSTVQARASDVDVTIEATGTVTPLNSVEIRPQLSNVITEVHIREGQFVKAGQLLFTLDTRNDEVIVAKAKAVLAKDMAALADAQRQLRRSLELLEQKFISQGADRKSVV